MRSSTRAAAVYTPSPLPHHDTPFLSLAGCLTTIRRPWQSRAVAAHQAHNLEVGGPNPSSAPTYTSILITSLIAQRPFRRQTGWSLCLRKLGDCVFKTCPTCGKLHAFDEVCQKQIENRRQYLLLAADKSKCDRDSKAKRFRSSQAWQRKRAEVRARDLNICRYCFLVKHKITTADLSVHHIIPIERDYSKRLSGRNLITLCRECHERAEKGTIGADILHKLVVEKLKI